MMSPNERAMAHRTTPATPGTTASASRPAPSALQAQTAKAMAKGYWAAKKTLPDGREARYWKGKENKVGEKGIRDSGWYVRGYSGGWQDSTTKISDDPLSAGETGVELLPRTVSPFAPGHNLGIIEDASDFTTGIAGRERSGRLQVLTSMPDDLVATHLDQIAAWCESIDALIEMFEKNEQDVTKWRNRMGALSASQIVLGVAGLVAAGTVIGLTGGLAAIPMAAGAIAISVASASAGVAVGTAKTVAEVSLKNAQQEGGVQQGRASAGLKDTTRGVVGVGTKEILVRTLPETAPMIAAQGVSTGATGAGAAFSIVSGSLGVHKARKVDVGAIFNSVSWDLIQQDIIEVRAFVSKHAKDFDPVRLGAVKSKISSTKTKVNQIMVKRSQHRHEEQEPLAPTRHRAPAVTVDTRPRTDVFTKPGGGK